MVIISTSAVVTIMHAVSAALMVDVSAKAGVATKKDRRSNRRKADRRGQPRGTTRWCPHGISPALS